MFVQTENKQEAASMEALVLSDLLLDLLSQKPELQGKLLSAREWEEKVQDGISNHDLESKQLLTARYIGWALKAHEQTFVRSLGMKKDKNSHSKLTLYSLNLSDALETQLVHVSPEATAAKNSFQGIA
jgi:hypothetical protein